MSDDPIPAWAPELPMRNGRVLLRRHEISDLEDLVRFHGDPRTTRYLPWPVRDREQTREALQKKLDQHRAPREGDWLVLAVEEVATGEVIGEIDLKRGARRRGELGYVVRRDREGRGLASEAVTAILRYAFDELALEAVDAHISPGNDSSERFAARFGFERDGARDGVDPANPTRAYTLTRRTWESNRAGRADSDTRPPQGESVVG